MERLARLQTIGKSGVTMFRNFFNTTLGRVAGELRTTRRPFNPKEGPHGYR